MKKRLFVVLLAFACLISVSASVQTKRVRIDYKALSEGILNNGGIVDNNIRFYFYDQESNDSIFRFTAILGNGKAMSVPERTASNSSVPLIASMRPGNSLKIDAESTGLSTKVRNVTKVEIRFDSSSYNNASQVTARCGTLTFNNNTTAPVVTWTGNSKSIELFMTKTCLISNVFVTIEHRDGADVIAHPVFSPVDQSDFHTASKTVTISSPTPGAEIYYSLNNRNANATFTKYTGPLTISNTTYIRAYCKKGTILSGEDTCRIVKNTSNMVVKDKAFYQSKTYTWIDVKGVRGTPGATITSDMTEEAITTEQIMALLKAVYTDPTIPGQVYLNAGEPASYAGYKTNPRDAQHGFWTVRRREDIASQWQINPLTQDPVEGYTALLVKVRDDFVKADYDRGIFRHGDKSATTYSTANDYDVYRAISESYESVQMLFGNRYGFDANKGWPEQGYNPGTLYSFSGTLNRFFIISKGSSMWSASYPLLGLFEELAPYNNNDNVYAAFADGKSFPVVHVCGGVVPFMNHVMQLDPEAKSYQLNNLNVFIPDYRLKYWERGSHTVAEYQQYFLGKEIRKPLTRDIPSVGIVHYHGMHLPTFAEYTVKLNATASPTATEHVYRATPSWTSTLDGLSPATGVPQEYLLYVVTDDGEGGETLTPLNGGNTLSANSFSYDVPQQATSREITYLVKARPAGSDIDFVLSNKATVVIPGYEETRYGLLDVGEAHLCNYLHDKEVNAYCNYLRLSNDPDYPILAEQLEQGTVMELIRYDHNRQEMGTVGSVTITDKATDGGMTTLAYRIDINDDLQSEADESRYHNTTGTITADAAGMVDFGDLYIADQFAASTASNTHPQCYYYQLKMIDALGHAIESHMAQVSVHKTGLDVTVSPLTKNDVDNDTDHALSLERTLTLSMTVGNEANLLTYTALSDDVNTVAHAQRTLDGKYTTKGLTTEGLLVNQEENIPFSEGHLTMQLPITTHIDMNRPHTFVPVVAANTHDIDGSLVVSTYGADKKSEPIGSLTVTVSNLERSNPWAASPRWLMSYSCDVTLSSTLPDGQSRYLYRLWRVNPDGTETLLNGQPENSGSNAAASWSTSYGNLSSTDATVTVHDIFDDLPLYSFEGSAMDVSYIVRLYSRYGGQSAPSGAPGRPRRAYTADDFTLMHTASTVRFDMGVVTAVGVTEINRSPVSVTYHNALGVASSRPFSGVNIVVTRYSDGTIKTEKSVR